MRWRAALLGGMLGRLHTRSAQELGPGGGRHHLPSGTPADEIAAGQALLDDMAGSVSVRDLARLDRLRDAAQECDGCADLPHAFVHPDCVVQNAVSVADERLVLVDWTGAGHGPRLWSLGFLLWAAGTRHPRLLEVAVSRYARHIALEPEELTRLGAAIRGRPLMLECWAVAHGRRTLTDARTSRSHGRPGSGSRSSRRWRSTASSTCSGRRRGDRPQRAGAPVQRGAADADLGLVPLPARRGGHGERPAGATSHPRGSTG